MAESRLAQLTAAIKAALKTITIANGYSVDVATVEEQRLSLNINGRTPFILLLKAPIEIDQEYNRTIITNVTYVAVFTDDYNDDDDDSNEIVYQYRNVHADIIKAIQVDPTFGGLAEGLRLLEFDDSISTSNGNTFFESYVAFEVKTWIDDRNPYLGGS